MKIAFGKESFINSILNKSKTITLRTDKKKPMYKVGQEIELWRVYPESAKIKNHKFANAIITHIGKCIIDNIYKQVFIYPISQQLTEQQLLDFVKKDGFETIEEFWDFHSKYCKSNVETLVLIEFDIHRSRY